MRIQKTMLNELSASYRSSTKAIDHQEARRERKVSYIDVKREIINGEIIESCSGDFPHPSCLVLLKIDSEPVHIVRAPAEKGLIIMTIYKPGMEEWDGEFKKRKTRE